MFYLVNRNIYKLRGTFGSVLLVLGYSLSLFRLNCCTLFRLGYDVISTIIIIIIIIITTFVQGMYSYIHETNRVCKVHIVAAIQ